MGKSVAAAAALLLVAAGCGGEEAGSSETTPAGPATPASAAPTASDAAQTSGATTAEPESSSAAPSDAPSAIAGDEVPGTCRVPEIDGIVAASVIDPDCGQVRQVFATVAQWGFPGDVDAEEEGIVPAGWGCFYAAGQTTAAPSEFTDLAMCDHEDVRYTLLPPGTAPLPGTAEDMAEHAVSSEIGTYHFRVPGTDLICGIEPEDDGERGLIGCNGTFAEGIEAPADEGTAPVNTVSLNEAGARFSVSGDPSFWAQSGGGTGWLPEDQVPALAPGTVLYAYGIACSTAAEATLTCTAGEGAKMTVSPRAHTFEPERPAQG